MPGRDARLATSDALASRLSGMADGELRELVAGRPADWSPWGGTHRIALDGAAVFVKRVPVTELEMLDPTSTRNVFDLPLVYSYGVGSAGFGGFREASAHRIASDLVRTGVTDGFPLLHHARVVECTEPLPPFPRDVGDYVTRWNDDQRIRAYVEARSAARHELWMFSEAVPTVVHDWIPTRLDRVDALVAGLFDAVGALRSVGIVHFDAHFGNALTDGTRFFLSDFGLAMSERFELDDDERAFLRRHRWYDQALIVSCLGTTALRAVAALEPARRAQVRARLGIDEDTERHETLVALLDRAPDLAASGVLDLPAPFVAALQRFADVITATDGFLSEVRRPEKAARFDDEAVGELFRAAGVDAAAPPRRV